MRLGFRVVMDARDPSAGLYMRQPSDGMTSRQPGGAMPRRQFMGEQPPRYPEGDQQPADSPRREAMPGRQPVSHPNRPSGGRHRRAVPNRLPQGAPALVLAVPGSDTDLTAGAAGEISTIL